MASADVLPAALLPWEQSHLELGVDHDHAVAAIWYSPSPRPDELLHVRGMPIEAVLQRVGRGLHGDPLTVAAMESGSASAPPSDETRAFVGERHLAVCAAPEALSERRWWWLAFARRQPFTSNELELASLRLRRWQVRFNAGDAPGACRLLLGGDYRLLVGCMDIRELMVHRPTLLHDLVEAFAPVVAQRYPVLPDPPEVDLVVSLQGVPVWLAIRHLRPQPGAPPPPPGQPGADRLTPWLVELRPTDEHEPPPIGVVSDVRVAQAIAFLHANYHQSPSLADVGRAVHTSPYHFHRLFSREVGLSPKRYLQRRQLQVARWLLRASVLPIGEVAGRTGFTSHGHFTSTFHQLIGQSPRQYREHAREQNVRVVDLFKATAVSAKPVPGDLPAAH